MFKAPNQFRLKGHHLLGSDNSFGNNGVFVIPHPKVSNYEIRVQCSDGLGWEHVSVSVAEKRKQPRRCPTWEEMCYTKSLFWSEDDCVVQYHPAKTEYVNMHQFVLHLWRPIDQIIPTPEKIMIGF